MKKVIFVLIGLIVILAIVFSVCKIQKDNEYVPSEATLTQYYDDYLTYITQNKDSEIYNNLLDSQLRKKFSEEQISQMFEYLKSLGPVKEYNKDEIKVETVNEDNKDIYVISSKIIYEKMPQLVKIKLIKRGKELKVIAFSFTSE